jgi:deoxyribodipyrimidine photo-lyase
VTGTPITSSPTPEVVDRAVRGDYDAIEWRDDEDGFRAWAEGRTGYPIVDAGMRQLAETGWMHNRVRMITASFLVKDLLIDWRRGERHFRHLLTDGDVAQNVGNWQWVAGTGPTPRPYFRIFNPVTQSEVRSPTAPTSVAGSPSSPLWTTKAIHAPWEAAPLDLAVAGVVLGDTYPAPIVDHGAARERTLAAYKAAVA